MSWRNLDDPLAGIGFNLAQGTQVSGISGTNIVGFYADVNGYGHGFLYDGSTWTTLDDPLGYFTWARGISGTNIVGFYLGANGVHGFLYNGSTWTTLDDPLGVERTYCTGISGANIVGYCVDSNGITHGFLAAPTPQLSLTGSGNSLKISWPYNPLTAWTLQQNPDLSTTNWTTIDAPSNDGTNNFTTIRSPTGSLFFRLKQ